MEHRRLLLNSYMPTFLHKKKSSTIAYLQKKLYLCSELQVMAVESDEGRKAPHARVKRNKEKKTSKAGHDLCA